MKFKRITSAVMAAVMAVTSAVVCEVTVSAAPATIVSNETLIGWSSNPNIDLTSKGTPTADATITITLDSAVGDAEHNVVFKICDSSWKDIYQQNVESSTNTSLTTYTYSIANDLGGNTSFIFMAGHSQITYSLTVSDVEAPPYEGTKLAMPVNGTYNYQGAEALTLPSAVSISNAKDIIDNYGNVTVTVPLNGAVSGSDTNFDLTKLSFQLMPKTDKGGTWPWVAAGTSTYDATTKTVTITADLAAALNGNTSIAAAPEDYTFYSLDLVVACDFADATAAIDLYHGTPTVTFAPATVPVTDVTLNKTTLELVEDASETLTATVTPDNATDKTVTWTSDDSTIATVDENGKVTAVKAGTTKITATAGEKSAKCTVTVKAKVVEATSITIGTTTDSGNTLSLGLKVGDEKALEVKFTPENTTDKSVTWESSAPTVATVDNDGVVKALKAGTAKITAKTANGKTATCTVTVSDVEIPVKTVTMTKPPVTKYTVGQTLTLTAAVNADANVANKTISWKSSDDSVATVKDGKVTFLKAAEKVTIEAYYSSADSAITDSIDFTVVDYIESDVKYNEKAKNTPVKVDATLDAPNTDVYVFAISDEDAAKCNYLEVTVTLPDGTTKTIKLDTVYSKFQFKNADGAKVVETGADGTYFGLVKVTGSLTLRDQMKLEVKPCI